jgi:hypothetical protein
VTSRYDYIFYDVNNFIYREFASEAKMQRTVFQTWVQACVQEHGFPLKELYFAFDGSGMAHVCCFTLCGVQLNAVLGTFINKCVRVHTHTHSQPTKHILIHQHTKAKTNKQTNKQQKHTLSHPHTRTHTIRSPHARVPMLTNPATQSSLRSFAYSSALQTALAKGTACKVRPTGTVHCHHQARLLQTLLARHTPDGSVRKVDYLTVAAADPAARRSSPSWSTAECLPGDRLRHRCGGRG